MVSGSEIALRVQENPPTLDPAKAARTLDGHLACLLHAGLVRADEKGDIRPELAESWEPLGDAPGWRFRLKEGWTFPSGRSVTASDVVYSYHRVCRPETASPTAWAFEDVLGYPEVQSGSRETLIGIRAASERVVEIELAEPSASFLAQLTMPVARIVDRREIEEKGNRYGRAPRGLGAWELVEWIDDSHLRFRPNPRYPEHNTQIETLIFKIVPQDFTAGALFETGEIQVLDPLPLSWEPRLGALPDRTYQTQTVTQLNVYYLGMGCHRPPLDRIEVRKAIRAAIDVESIRIALFAERAVPAYGPIPPGLVGHRDTSPSTDFPEARMAELLDGLELDLWFVDNDSTHSLAMEAVQAELSEYGVQVRLRRTDPTTYSSWRREGRFDLFLGNWWADFPDPDNFFAPLFLSTSASNTTRISDAELDDRILVARKELDPERRGIIYREGNNRLEELCPAVFLWHRNNKALMSGGVRGYRSPRLFQGALFLELALENGSGSR